MFSLFLTRVKVFCVDSDKSLFLNIFDYFLYLNLFYMNLMVLIKGINFGCHLISFKMPPKMTSVATKIALVPLKQLQLLPKQLQLQPKQLEYHQKHLYFPPKQLECHQNSLNISSYFCGTQAIFVALKLFWWQINILVAFE